MKKIIILMALLFLARASFATELTGAWELESGEYINEQGQLINYNAVDFHSLKVLSATHFSFTSVRGDKFWASGSGTYELSKGKYKEVLKYNSFGQSQGAEFVFDSKVEGDFWYNSRWEGETRVEYEVWRRVE